MNGPNVLLVVLDSVRARNCGIHGYDNDTTPFLSTFLDGATQFDQARAPSIHSVSSHASLFSGYHTEQHGVTEHWSRLDPEAHIFHELGESCGFETGIFTPNAVVAESSNLAACFQHRVGPVRNTDETLFDDASSPRELPEPVDPVQYVRWTLSRDMPIRSILNGIYYRFVSLTSHDPTSESADVYVDHLIEWIDDRDGKWAACINLMDAHYPYVPKVEHDVWGGEAVRRLRDGLPDGPPWKVFLEGHPWGQLRALEPLYDGCIRQMDAELERLIGYLDTSGELEDTLVVVTSDHGEGFGERSKLDPAVRLATHNWGIGETLTHVPLIVKHPGQVRGKRITRPATLTRFPSVVRGLLAGERDPASAFVPVDEPVISSTYRIRPPGDSLPLPEADREHYFGPWRAIYTVENGSVLKHACRGEDTVALRVPNAQVSYEVDRDGDVLDRVFAMMDCVDVKGEETTEEEMSPMVMNRLEELGYFA